MVEYNTVDITLDDDTIVQLRLSTKALIKYHKEHGIEGAPIVASVMGAIDDVEAKAALLEAAMRWPGHHNDTKAIPTGADLMDHMLYAGYCYDQINGVIVQLAQHAGLVSETEAQRLESAALASGTKWVDRLEKLLLGQDPTDSESQQTDGAENPT